RSATARPAGLRAASIQDRLHGQESAEQDRYLSMSAVSAHPLAQRRPLGDRGFAILALASGLLVLVILVLIAVSTSQQASSWFATAGLSGVFSTHWNPAANQFGAVPFIYGTAITAVIALILAVPVSIGIGLLLTEVVPHRWARPIVYIID